MKREEMVHVDDLARLALEEDESVLAESRALSGGDERRHLCLDTRQGI